MTPAVPISFSQPCRGKPSRYNSLLCIRLREFEVPCSRSLRRLEPVAYTQISKPRVVIHQVVRGRAITGRAVREKNQHKQYPLSVGGQKKVKEATFIANGAAWSIARSGCCRISACPNRRRRESQGAKRFLAGRAGCISRASRCRLRRAWIAMRYPARRPRRC